jgi:transposase-like protein
MKQRICPRCKQKLEPGEETEIVPGKGRWLCQDCSNEVDPTDPRLKANMRGNR